MKGTKFYKRNHLITVYDEYDDLVTVCDNAKEFAKRFKLDYDASRTLLSRVYNGLRARFVYKGQNYYIHFIELEVNEVREFQVA